MPTATLNYCQPDTALPSRKRSIVWLILALPTLAIPFASLECDTSPVKVLCKSAQDLSKGTLDKDAVALCSLAICLCCGALAFVWRCWTRWRRTSRAARIVAICVGMTAVLTFLTTLAILVIEDGPALQPSESVALIASFLAGLACGAMLWARRRRSTADDFVLGSLLTPFVAGGTFCLIGFGGDDHLQWGWYLTLFSVPMSFVDLVFLTFGKRNSDQKETAGETPAVVNPIAVEPDPTLSRPAPP